MQTIYKLNCFFNEKCEEKIYKFKSKTVNAEKEVDGRTLLRCYDDMNRD